MYTEKRQIRAIRLNLKRRLVNSYVTPSDNPVQTGMLLLNHLHLPGLITISCIHKITTELLAFLYVDYPFYDLGKLKYCSVRGVYIIIREIILDLKKDVRILVINYLPLSPRVYLLYFFRIRKLK